MAEKLEVPTSSHFTPLERKIPATGKDARGGESRGVTGGVLAGGDTAHGPWAVGPRALVAIAARVGSGR